MIKRIIMAVVAIGVIILVIMVNPVVASENATLSEANIPSETSTADYNYGVITDLSNMLNVSTASASIEENEVEITETAEDLSYDEIVSKIDEYQSKVDAAQQILAAAETLEYDDTNPVITVARNDLTNYQYQLLKYNNLLEEYKESIREQEYPVATEVWNFLEDKGYSDVVIAGILGNMMSEVGGQTLNLQPYSSNGIYYGICQWKISSHSSVYNTGLEDQLNFLCQTIEEEFETYGYKYQDGFTYGDFCNLTNEQDVALAFAKVYERCENSNYYVRTINATEALAYYTN